MYSSAVSLRVRSDKSLYNKKEESKLAKSDIAHMHKNPHLGEGRSYGVSVGTIRKSDGRFL